MDREISYRLDCKNGVNKKVNQRINFQIFWQEIQKQDWLRDLESGTDSGLSLDFKTDDVLSCGFKTTKKKTRLTGRNSFTDP